MSGKPEARRKPSVRRPRVQQPQVVTHHPVLGWPLPQDVIDDMAAHGETDYYEGYVRRFQARYQRDLSTAIRERATGTRRELAKARQQFFRGVIFGTHLGLCDALLKLRHPGNKEQSSGEYQLGCEAGQALATILLEQHGAAIRRWLRRAAGQRGGRP